MDNKYFDTPFYGWCDIGYFRNKNDTTNTRDLINGRWPKLGSLFPTAKSVSQIHYACVQNNEDLFYRLNVIQLDVPPLRERHEDIVELTDVILGKLKKQYQFDAIKLSASAREQLLQYQYPGNVRELENILERAFALCDFCASLFARLEKGGSSLTLVTHHSHG